MYEHGNVGLVNNPTDPENRTQRLRSFVRRGGRMTAAQENAWNLHSDLYLVQVERDGGATTVAKGVSQHPHEMFGREAPLVVEIGTGAGEALIHAATEHPEMNFLGLEVYQVGLARAMLNAHKGGLTNIRLIEANAAEVLEHFLPEATVSELRIFFPDPWHKARHNKRRLIVPSFIELASRVLVPGGIVRMATDWEEYAEQMRDVFDTAPTFLREFEDDWAERFAGRPITNFERKGTSKGRDIRDLTYRFEPTHGE